MTTPTMRLLALLAAMLMAAVFAGCDSGSTPPDETVETPDLGDPIDDSLDTTTNCLQDATAEYGPCPPDEVEDPIGDPVNDPVDDPIDDPIKDPPVERTPLQVCPVLVQTFDPDHGGVADWFCHNEDRVISFEPPRIVGDTCLTLMHDDGVFTVNPMPWEFLGTEFPMEVEFPDEIDLFLQIDMIEGGTIKLSQVLRTEVEGEPFEGINADDTYTPLGPAE